MWKISSCGLVSYRFVVDDMERAHYTRYGSDTVSETCINQTPLSRIKEINGKINLLLSPLLHAIASNRGTESANVARADTQRWSRFFSATMLVRRRAKVRWGEPME
jgi:hypothetical protein